jgi:hypothetical protein
MSSTLIRRIAAVVVAAVVPFGAAASSAHASTWSPAPQAHVLVSDDDGGVDFTPIGPWRSSWS